MNASEMPMPIFVVSDDALRDLVDMLSSETLLAIDTESNSMYVYRSRVCLIQVSTREHDYIIDPLAIEDMQPFGELMKNPDIEKIFHGAEYDLLCLKRDFNFELVNLFDTMLTARLLRLEVQGLADLLYAYFQIDMDKTQRLSNWGVRPLT
ncbi:MAG: ribonuclease D, partial [Aggregatilineales bacterium]